MAKGQTIKQRQVLKRGAGRPPLYTAALASEICKRLAAGETLRSICRTEGMPAHSTVLSWTISDEAFSDQYTRAREIGYQIMADEVLEIADDGRNDCWKDEEGNPRTDHDVIARSRLRVDTRKWLLSKALPKVYGDRQAIEHTGKDGGPIKTENTTTLDASQLEPEDRQALREVLKAARGE